MKDETPIEGPGLARIRIPKRQLRPDVRALADALARRIAGEVRFDDGTRALYATDASNYRFLPIGVVMPKTKDDVIATVAECRRHGVPIVHRGAGTGLAGQTCNDAVVIDDARYFGGILELDAPGRRARVLPGTVLDALRDRAELDHLTFGPDPATHQYCTLGGMISNNSCGAHAVLAGCVEHLVRSLEILTYDGLRLTVGPTPPEERRRIIAAGGRRGELYAGLERLVARYGELVRARYPKIPRRVSGYNLNELLPEHGFHVARALVGSEGTCVTILEAELDLVHSPPHRTMLVLGYPDVFAAGDRAAAIMQHGPTALEGLDRRLIENMRQKHLHTEDLRYLPAGEGWLMVELGGESKEEADAKARAVMDILSSGKSPPTMKLYDDPHAAALVWKVRESGLGATARVPGNPDTWPGWEDSAVPPERVGDYLRDLRQLFERYDYRAALYGHFGQGCIHCRISFDLVSAEGIAKYRRFLDDAAGLVLRYGGSLSGEHGDGQSRGELLTKMFGEELVGAFGEFKRLWDPDGKMNPGKVVDARPITADLRLGTDFNPPPVETKFAFPDDEGDFTRATLRCVGVGKCRRTDEGTMCPSYQVTREEQHTTRGRAHLLFEMMRGDELALWDSEPVKEALDLCLACKGCKGECPVNVDMATLKAEFLSHYYERHHRPRTAYAMGLVMYWAKLFSALPALVNTLGEAPLTGAIARFAAGLAQSREIPAVFGDTFRARMRRHRPKHPDGKPVILWPDTFNDHFLPDTAMAAVEALESAGFRVEVPQTFLCCGRPLYDYGLLDRARRLLVRTLDALEDRIEAGVPVVGLEPSCATVFRDELVSMLPHDRRAQRLKQQTFLFAEFLRHHAPDGWRPPRLERDAVVHGHCHHKSLWQGISDEESLLREMGISPRVLDSGCCGMAGSFGFEAGAKHEVSLKAGERVLLPSVRHAAGETLIVADGFSCREQIRQGTHRNALHVAEVVRMALHTGPRGPRAALVEREWAADPDAAPRIRPARAAMAAVAAGVAAVLVPRRSLKIAAGVAAVASGALALLALGATRRRGR